MKHLVCIPLLLLSLIASSPSWGQDYDKGLAAAQRGDFTTAVREWTPLAEQGDVYAQFNLGQMYKNGDGVAQDYKAAVKWFSLAAQQGDANAQYNLGLRYYNGEGVPQDFKIAAKWFRLAAEQGVAMAQNNLGVSYLYGQGVLQDYVSAHMWGSIAIFNGYENGAKLRDIAAKKMSSADISAAQALARECMARDYKGC